MKIKNLIQSTIKQYFIAVAILFALISLFYNIQEFIGYQSVSLILLFWITLMPLLGFGRGPIIIAAFIAAMGWNYYFIPPHFTFHIAKPEDILMNALFFIVAVVTGVLTSRLKAQETFILNREAKTNSLYNLLKELSDAISIDQVTAISVKNIKKVFGYDSILIYASENGKLSPQVNTFSSFNIEEIDWVVAEWCFKNKEKAGRTTRNLPYVDCLYIPLTGTRQVLGSIGIKIPDGQILLSDEKDFLKTFIEQIIIAVEREILNENAKKNYLTAESEKLYRTLFNSISHELRTPITTILSAASSLQDDNVAKQKELWDSLNKEIKTAAERLNRLVENLLDMTRLESGQLRIKPEWNDINDLINSVLKRLKYESLCYQIKTNIALENSLFRFDFGLLEQAFINIVHNCIIYTPENSIISINIKEQDDKCIIEISDNGFGFPGNTLEHLFEKFYRAPGSKTGGTGLGLSIAKGFIDAHGGTISATNKKPHGASFTIILPINRNDGTTAENINNR